MRLVLFVALAAGLTGGLSVRPAAARDYPYCLQGRETGYPGDCAYQSYAQCQASASGRDVGCGINPRVAFQQQRNQGNGYGPRSRGFDDRW